MRTATTLDPKAVKTALSALGRADAAFRALHPGDSAERRPTHVVYGGAHLFKSDAARKLGDLALRSLSRHAPDAEAFARVLGLRGELARPVYDRVVEKLKREPVEDYRIDFEDGYGHRSDAEEDGHALAAALELAKGLDAGTLPPFVGIRIKALAPETAARAARTLDLFLSALVRHSRGRLPDGFRVTLPKASHPAQPAALARLLDAFERRKRLPRGAIKAELMIETPQAVLDAGGRSPLRALAAALGGRCAGAHFGAYDYSAACGVAASRQTLDHPSCAFARAAMQAALAGSGVPLSDGATTVLPVGPHRAAPGRALSPAEERENAAAVERGWRLHFENASRALSEGYYQGWDLHPAQLPARHAAVFAFFLDGLPEAAARLSRFVESSARASRIGGVFDDAATGQGLLNFFLRARACGALTEDEAASSGLTPEELAGRSFLRILEGRRAAAGV